MSGRIASGEHEVFCVITELIEEFPEARRRCTTRLRRS